MANNEEGIKEMMRKFGKYVQELELKMNTEKSKMMRDGKGQGRSKKVTFNWKGKEIEVVKMY